MKMTHQQENSFKNLIAFNKSYFDENSVKNNKKIIAQIFEENYLIWKKMYGLICCGENLDELIGKALLTYSFVVDSDNLFTFKRLKTLRECIEMYEAKVKYFFKLKAHMYNSIAYSYAKENLNKDSIDCFKKSFFYLFSELNRTVYMGITCFAFHSLSKHMLHNLSEETLNVASPLKFNDVFDCPMIKLLDNDIGPSKLRRQALCDCVKIACFDKKDFLMTCDDALSEKKRAKNKEFEYCNELLWSHYADYHKGICIEYVFNSSLFKSAQDNSTIVSFFKDVDYLDNIDSIKNGTSIKILDGFFVKSKAWKYENELRFFHFNLKGSGDYESVKIKKCVKSITFGVLCPENDKILVMKLMKNRKYEIIKDEKKNERRIEFYQMKTNDEIFGKLTRESIYLYGDKIRVKSTSQT